MKQILVVLVILLAVLPVDGEPLTPMQALRTPIDQVVVTLRDPQYQNAAQRGIQHKTIQGIINDIFDFDAIAMRAVGRNWRTFSPEERREFSDVFAQLLSNSYIRKMQGEFRNEQVVYVGSDAKSPTKSLVKTKIVRDTVEIPVNYSLRFKNDKWNVYDVNIEGVSLVKNYRTQFNKILSKKTPAALIQQVKKKVNDLQTKEQRGN